MTGEGWRASTKTVAEQCVSNARAAISAFSSQRSEHTVLDGMYCALAGETTSARGGLLRDKCSIKHIAHEYRYYTFWAMHRMITGPGGAMVGLFAPAAASGKIPSAQVTLQWQCFWGAMHTLLSLRKLPHSPQAFGPQRAALPTHLQQTGTARYPEVFGGLGSLVPLSHN